MKKKISTHKKIQANEFRGKRDSEKLLKDTGTALIIGTNTGPPTKTTHDQGKRNKTPKRRKKKEK